MQKKHKNGFSFLLTLAGIALATPCFAKATYVKSNPKTLASVYDKTSVKDWPVARRFGGDKLLRVALPMGGIGCGSVSLSGRGELVDWEIMNRANKTMSEAERGALSRTFFAIRVKGASHESTTMLAGPLHPTELYAAEGNCAPQSGLPRFREASFEGAFPFGMVHLADKDLPVKVTIKGFSPFVPGDSAASSLPVASLEYDVENISNEPLEVSVAVFARNIVGNDGNPTWFTYRRLTNSGGEKNNRTVFREGAGLRGIMCLSDGVASNSPAWGTFAVSTPDSAGSVTYRESYAPNDWGGSALDFWDDLSDDGEFTPRPSGKGTPHGGLSLKKSLPANAKEPFRFAITWNFPNRPAWSDTKKIVGNWYSQNYKDAWDAAEKIVPRLGELERRSLAFTRKILALDAPAEIKEAALSNLSVLKSQTVFRVPSGHLLGWEGVFDHEGSCQGSCTHVWNYENAVACLFPDLARSMREVEFKYALNTSNGAMAFRVPLPLGRRPNNSVAADGQMGCIMKVYRDWRISGDGKWLASLWPRVKMALAFAWIPPEKWTWNAKWHKGGWDVGKSGLMDGEQHNTMDVNYYGPNPQMGFWYLGALRAAEEMAIAMKDDAFAKECREIYEKGTRRIDEELFNGDYYEQHITEGHGELPYQLGKCCLVDQLVGQQMAHLWDLGDLAKKENLKKTCESIMRWNWRGDFSRHFNNMRTYCAGDEAGLLMGSWPRGRLKTPFPYFGEVMTGFEYVAAAEMVFQGMDDDAVKVVKAIRDRHDGLKRNPFSEPECGHNYARSMASWNVLLAWLKMHGGKADDLIWRAAAPAPDTLIAHRGESFDAPENTLPAYKMAVERGFGFECDVYLSKDGRVFTFHDGSLTRTTGGANTNKCSDVTWAEIEKIDVGSWGPWKGSKFEGTRPALLEEVLELARDGRKIYIEVKPGPDIVPYIKDIIRKQSNATPKNALFISFNAKTCKALKEELPEYKVYWIVSPVDSKRYAKSSGIIEKLKEIGSDGVDCNFNPRIVTAKYIRDIREAGFEFHVWTVDTLPGALEAFKRGAQTVTTNCAKKLLDEFYGRKSANSKSK